MDQQIVKYNPASQMPNIRIGIWFEGDTTAAQTWYPTEGLTLDEAIAEAKANVGQTPRPITFVRALEKNEWAGHSASQPVQGENSQREN
jgi:hypothetical protein